jgi:drug/metabolite transporter (DMT)-like permease
MGAKSNVIAPSRITGPALATVGMLGFSLSLPATKVAVGGLDPWFVAFGRAVGAAVLAGAYLWLTGAPAPTRAQARRLAVVALGVVVGFPLGTSLALQTQTSAHGAVVVGVLPAMTAALAAARLGERHPARFWLSSAAGLVAALLFIAASGGLRGDVGLADLFLLGAVACCAAGYAEGGALARELGGARTICWALVLASPITVVVAGASVASSDLGGADGGAWLGFGYVTVVSMFLGFIAWYAGLAKGGVARMSQVQLAQPVLTLTWSALLLGERIGPLTVVAAAAVLACVLATQRTR